jgi:hypothetical protein
MKILIVTFALILCSTICDARPIRRTVTITRTPCANGVCNLGRKVEKKVEIKRPNTTIEKKITVDIEAPKPL